MLPVLQFCGANFILFFYSLALCKKMEPDIKNAFCLVLKWFEESSSFKIHIHHLNLGHSYYRYAYFWVTWSSVLIEIHPLKIFLGSTAPRSLRINRDGNIIKLKSHDQSVSVFKYLFFQNMPLGNLFFYLFLYLKLWSAVAFTNKHERDFRGKIKMVPFLLLNG